MKTLISFLLFALFVLLGCENKPISDVNEVSYMQNIDRQINEINGEIREATNLYNQLSGGGYVISSMEHPIMLSDVANAKGSVANLKAAKANVQITKANLEASEKLIHSIEQFDRSSTKLSKYMLCLTICILILTFVIAVLTYLQMRTLSSYKVTSIKAPLEKEATAVSPEEESPTVPPEDEPTAVSPEEEATAVPLIEDSQQSKP